MALDLNNNNLLNPLLICLLTLFVGCAPPPQEIDITILNGAELESLDPAIVTGQADLRVVSALFEGLTRSDPKTGRPIAGLAENWSISDDGLSYRFYLRPNLQWSTGDLISSDDIVYSWRRALAPETASDYAGQFYCITNAESYNRGLITNASLVGVTAKGRTVLEVQLAAPTAFFLDLCTLPALAVVPRQTIESFGDQWIKAKPLPVSGAYCLAYWRINDKIRLQKNPRYWDVANTQNEWVDILPVGNAGTAINLYETHAADVVWDKELAPTELLDELLARSDFHPFDYLATYFIRINVTKKPFNDPKIRCALAMAIDKRRIVEKITKAGERVANQLTPSGIADYIPPKGLSYDPERARAILAAAGYPEGKGFPSFAYLFNAAAGGGAKTHQKIGIELQEMWKRELGISMELRQVESKIFLAAQSALDYDICRSSWVGDYCDPNTFLDLFMSNSGNNRTGWRSQQYDRALSNANAATDPRKRLMLLRDVEAILIEEELPIIPLFFYKGICYYRPDEITGIYPNLIDQHPINALRRISRK